MMLEEEWYAQRDQDDLDREEHNCMRLARQFCHLNVLFQSPTRSVAAHLKCYLLHMYYAPQLNNLHHDKEIDQLELDWIT